MRNFKKILKCIIFAIVCCIAFAICDFVFVPSGYIRVILHTLNYSEEKYDCIILGASHGRSAINPYKLDDTLGTNAINLCIPSETMEDSYYLLKESCRNNNPKTVILDLDYQYWYKLAENDFSDAFIYYQLAPSKVKAEYFINNLITKDVRITLSRWSNYVNDFSNIKDKMALKLGSEYKDYDINGANVKDANGPYVGNGFFYRAPGAHGARGLVVRRPWSDSKVDNEVVKQFENIVNYCKENEIKLICVTSTITPATVLTGTSEASSKYFTALMGKYGVDYYDFNLLRQDVMPRGNLDFGDWDGHMCGTLADKYSSIMGSVIKDKEQGKLDKTKYFYDSYSKLFEDINTVIYCETSLNIVKKDDQTYNISFNVDSLQGTKVVPEYQIIVGTTTGATVLSDYSKQSNYSFDLPKGTYTIRVNARAVGSTAEYEEYCEKAAVLGQ